MFGLNRNLPPHRSAVTLKARRHQLEAVIDIAESCEGGIFKRIAELRETAQMIRTQAPVFGDANPWLFRWLGSTDEFLCAIAGALHPLDLSRHRGGVQWYSGIFPLPELGPPEHLYGMVHRLHDKAPPRFWRRVSADEYAAVPDQQRAIDEHQADGAGDRGDYNASAPDLHGEAWTRFGPFKQLPAAIRVPSASRKTLTELQRDVIATDIAQLLAAAEHAEASARLARAQGLPKPAEDHERSADEYRARASARSKELSQ